MDATSETVAPVIIIAVAIVIAAPLTGLWPSPFGEPNSTVAGFKDAIKHTNALLWKSSVQLKNGFNIYAGESNVIDLEPDLTGARSVIFKTDDGELFDITVTGRGIKSIEFNENSRTIILGSDGTEGMLKISVSKELLGDQFSIKVGGHEADFTVFETETEIEVLVYRPADSNVIFVLGTPKPILSYP